MTCLIICIILLFLYLDKCSFHKNKVTRFGFRILRSVGAACWILEAWGEWTPGARPSSAIPLSLCSLVPMHMHTLDCRSKLHLYPSTESCTLATSVYGPEKFLNGKSLWRACIVLVVDSEPFVQGILGSYVSRAWSRRQNLVFPLFRRLLLHRGGHFQKRARLCL